MPQFVSNDPAELPSRSKVLLLAKEEYRARLFPCDSIVAIFDPVAIEVEVCQMQYAKNEAHFLLPGAAGWRWRSCLSRCSLAKDLWLTDSHLNI